MTTNMPRLTSNQKDRLLRLGRRSTMLGGRPGGWILDRTCGGPAALEHLFDKGYVERETRRGPRGGRHLYYRPNEAGFAVIDRATAKEEARHAQATGSIDQAIINARRSGDPICVYLNETVYFRGVPGEIERHAKNGKLILPIGMRRVRLDQITKVLPG